LIRVHGFWFGTLEFAIGRRQCAGHPTRFGLRISLLFWGCGWRSADGICFGLVLSQIGVAIRPIARTAYACHGKHKSSDGQKF
jgi:hypothetical protein